MDDPMRDQDHKSEDVELDPETDARVDAMIEQAERDLAEMRRTGPWGPGEDSIPIETPAVETAQPVDVTVRFLRYQVEILEAQFKAIFHCLGQAPTRGLVPTQRFVLGAVLVYQLALLHRFESGDDLRIGLKPYLQAA